MAENLPHEIKRLIYDHADLETIKTLRLLSPSWAAVGLEILLLPTFVIKSYSIDIQRLIDIGSSERVALQAAKMIKTLEFRDNEYDPGMVRTILCSRHVQVSNYENVDFVPTELEQGSMDEIDAIIQQRRIDDEMMSSKPEEFLIEAFRNVPGVETIKFTFINPFQETLLRKVWNEYDFQMYDVRGTIPKCLELQSILSSINASGLKIKNFIHGRYSAARFLTRNHFDLSKYLTDLKILTLTIFDDTTPLDEFEEDRPNEDHIDKGLHDLLLANPDLEHLRLSFETLYRSPTHFFPTIQHGHLKTLDLTSVTLNSTDFLSFLTANAKSLKRISITQADIKDPQSTWTDLLEKIRNIEGFNIEMFQLSGLIRSATETWHHWPIYNHGWVEYKHDQAAKWRGRLQNNLRTKAIESFVKREREWLNEGEFEPDFDLKDYLPTLNGN